MIHEWWQMEHTKKLRGESERERRDREEDKHGRLDTEITAWTPTRHGWETRRHRPEKRGETD